tara:strand:+ start:267 stop:518 length:252 start_codon:yes stop_codon:yes gene_type:complete
MILANGRLRSRPRVNGTMQNAHMLSQPRIIDTNALGLTDGAFFRTGEMSAYVSSIESWTLITAFPELVFVPVALSLSSLDLLS